MNADRIPSKILAVASEICVAAHSRYATAQDMASGLAAVESAPDRACASEDVDCRWRIAALALDRCQQCSLRGVIARMVNHHSQGMLADLRLKPVRRLAHTCSDFSRIRSSGKPEVVVWREQPRLSWFR